MESHNSQSEWERHFNKHPFIVLAIFASAIITASWVYHTWTVEQLDKRYKDDLSSIEKRYKDKFDWLKEQQKYNKSSQDERCSIAKERLLSQLHQCQTDENELKSQLEQLDVTPAT